MTQSEQTLKLAHVNIKGLRYNVSYVENLLKRGNIDILSLNETKLCGYISKNEVRISGYRLYRRDNDVQHGGVALYVRDSVPHAKIPKIGGSEVESLWIKLNDVPLVIGSIYRHRQADQNYLNAIRREMRMMTKGTYNFVLLGDLHYDLAIPKEAKNIKVIQSELNCKNVMAQMKKNISTDVPQPTFTRGDKLSSLFDVILSDVPKLHDNNAAEDVKICAFRRRLITTDLNLSAFADVIKITAANVEPSELSRWKNKELYVKAKEERKEKAQLDAYEKALEHARKGNDGNNNQSSGGKSVSMKGKNTECIEEALIEYRSAEKTRKSESQRRASERWTHTSRELEAFKLKDLNKTCRVCLNSLSGIATVRCHLHLHICGEELAEYIAKSSK